MPDLITLVAGPSRLTVSPDRGGSITLWQWGDARLLRPIDDETTASGHARQLGCFSLLPYSNRIAEATLTFAGHVYALTPDPLGERHSIHGNAWYSPWHLLERSDCHMVLGLDHRPVGTAARDWPFAFDARQTLELGADGLSITLSITNRDDRPMPAGLGLHPYFRRSAGSTLCFEAAQVWRSGLDKLPKDSIPTPPGWSFATPRSPSAVELDNCFSGWTGSARITWPEDQVALTMTADPLFTHLVVFTPTGRDFFCVEPTSHANGAFHQPERAEKLGLRVLAPGQDLTAGIRFILESLA
jgi:aldose 1-epimerase